MGIPRFAQSLCPTYHLLRGFSSHVLIGVSVHKRMILMWVFFGCGGILSCSDWHNIFLWFPLQIACNLKIMRHTAHRRSLLSAAGSSSIRRHLTRSSTVHVDSSDNIRSCRAQCQAPPDNPETADSYHSRENRSRAGEKIEYQVEYKRYSSNSGGMYVHKRG